MRERLLKFMTRENLTSARLADELGVQPSSISHILSGRNNPGYDFMQKILSRYQNLNAEWLILGKGEMYKQVKQQELVFTDKPAIDATITPTVTPNPAPEKAVEKIIEPLTEKEVTTLILKIVIFYTDGRFHEFRPA
jgi:transcriptional regulator with XRE-family HTH domain